MVEVHVPVPRHYDQIRNRQRANRLTITNRGRKAVAIATLAATGLTGYAVGHASNSDRSTKPEQMVTYTVQPGDTVWQIARTLHGDGEIRPLVDTLQGEVEEMHENGELQPGDQLQASVSQVHNEDYLPKPKN